MLYHFEPTIEANLPAVAASGSRAHNNLVRFKSEHRPEADSKTSGGSRTAPFGRSVEREEKSLRVVERHAGSVVSATDAFNPTGSRGLEPDAMRAGVARVLQKLPHENPGVGPVPLGLQSSALQKGATSRIGHDDSVGPPSGKPMQGTRCKIATAVKS